MTFDELMKEVENYEKPPSRRTIILSENQKKFIALSLEKKISQSKMAKLWNRMNDWGKISTSGIKRRIDIYLGVKHVD